MATFAVALRTEIRRLAARDIQRALLPVRRMRRQLKTLRLVSHEQRRTIMNLERKLTRVQDKVRVQGRGVGRGAGAQGRPLIQASEIYALRQRMGLSRHKFAKLVGVSPGSIFGWEHGRTLPRGESVHRLRELEKRKAVAAKKSARQAPSAGRKRARSGKARR